MKAEVICQGWYWLNGVKTCSSNKTACLPNVVCGMNTIIDTSSGWQTCPKCAGQGKVWFPINMPYNPTFAGDGNPYECDVCNGKKIINISTGLPPQTIEQGKK